MKENFHVLKVSLFATLLTSTILLATNQQKNQITILQTNSNYSFQDFLNQLSSDKQKEFRYLPQKEQEKIFELVKQTHPEALNVTTWSETAYKLIKPTAITLFTLACLYTSYQCSLLIKPEVATYTALLQNSLEEVLSWFATKINHSVIIMQGITTLTMQFLQALKTILSPLIFTTVWAGNIIFALLKDIAWFGARFNGLDNGSYLACLSALGKNPENLIGSWLIA